MKSERQNMKAEKGMENERKGVKGNTEQKVRTVRDFLEYFLINPKQHVKKGTNSIKTTFHPNLFFYQLT